MSEHVANFGALVREEMERFNLFNMGWDYGYDRAKKRLGICQFGPKLLSFSLPYIEANTIDNMHNTILHEIAHALAGGRAGHGPIWKAKAIQIGAKPQRCNDDPNIIRPEGDYVFHCHCRAHYFHRKDALGAPKWCRKCGVKGRVVRCGAVVEMNPGVIVAPKLSMRELLKGLS